ncbi:uncharacterized protein [Watersipora subatra]|uniref:uncharacterized protein n=1 Tax=Watersipora subatra TaxID=2589382 RepID=UPI00355B267A
MEAYHRMIPRSLLFKRSKRLYIIYSRDDATTWHNSEDYKGTAHSASLGNIVRRSAASCINARVPSDLAAEYAKELTIHLRQWYELNVVSNSSSTCPETSKDYQPDNEVKTYSLTLGNLVGDDRIVYPSLTSISARDGCPAFRRENVFYCSNGLSADPGEKINSQKFLAYNPNECTDDGSTYIMKKIVIQKYNSTTWYCS